MRIRLCVAVLLGWATLALGQEGSSPVLAVPASSIASPAMKDLSSPAIIIGFVGGFIRHDDSSHGPVQLAARLREDFPSGVHVEVFENRRGKQAHGEILRLLDADHDGKLSPQEKQRARIIIYGHSWGGSEAVNLARRLQQDGIPVLLTVQLDSVAKPGQNDFLIPANVAEAVNFFQPDGLIHGRTEIRALDPARTSILGNFRFDYGANPLHCSGYHWFARLFEKTHIAIECDPAVLSQVESLIRSKLLLLP